MKDEYLIDQTCVPGCELDPATIIMAYRTALRLVNNTNIEQLDIVEHRWLMQRYLEHLVFDVGNYNPRTVSLCVNAFPANPTIQSVGQLMHIIAEVANGETTLFKDTFQAAAYLPVIGTLTYPIIDHDGLRDIAFKDYTFKLNTQYMASSVKHYAKTLTHGTSINLFRHLHTLCRKLGDTLYKSNEKDWIDTTHRMIVTGLEMHMIACVCLEPNLHLESSERNCYQQLLQTLEKKSFVG